VLLDQAFRFFKQKGGKTYFAKSLQTIHMQVLKQRIG